MPLRIRRANPGDAELIVEFNRRLAEETEGVALDATTLAEGVRACLNDADKGEYLLAEQGGQVLGQMMLTREWSDWRNGWMWWIQSVYVRKEARRRGVFTALFVHIEGLARSEPLVIGLRLYVERDNEQARQTYLRLGMRQTGYLLLEKYPLGENAASALLKKTESV